MPGVASKGVMLRSCALALLASAVFAATAAGATPTFDFPDGTSRVYTPSQITLTLSDASVCWSPQAVDFSQHPLTFDTSELANHTSGSSDHCVDITGLRPGFYAFHCAIHGHQGQEGSVGSGMSGSFTIPGDKTATPDFDIEQSGAAVTFTYIGGPDPDEGSGDTITKYFWDFDGNGSTDATTTEPMASRTYTANGTFHPTLRVIDKGHVLSAPVTHDVTISGIPDPSPPPPGGGTPPPAPGGGGGPTTDTTAPVVSLKIAKSLTVGKVLRVPFTTDESTSVTATLKVGKRKAKASKDFAAAGKHTLTIKLSKALRRALRTRRSVTLTLAATDDAGNGTTVKRTLKLRAR